MNMQDTKRLLEPLNTGEESTSRRRVGQILTVFVACSIVTFKVASVTVSPADLVLVGLVLAAGGSMTLSTPARSATFLLLALSIALASVVAIFNDDLDGKYMLSKMIGFAALALLFCIVTWWARTIERIERLVWTFVAAVVTAALAAAISFGATYATPSIVSADGLRLRGFVIDPNAFGSIVGLALVIAIGAGYTTSQVGRRFPPRLIRTAYFTCVAVLSASLALSNSRTAWIATASGMAVLIAYRSTRSRAIVALGAGILIVAVAGLAVADSYSSDFLRIAQRTSQIDAREELAATAFELYLTSPVVGLGLGGFRSVTGAIPHNTPIWLLVDAGPVGAGAYCLFLFGLAVRLIQPLAVGRIDRLRAALLAAVVVIATFSLGVESLYQRHAWVILGCAAAFPLAAGRIKRDVTVAPRQMPTSAGSRPRSRTPRPR